MKISLDDNQKSKLFKIIITTLIIIAGCLFISGVWDIYFSTGEYSKEIIDSKMYFFVISSILFYLAIILSFIKSIFFKDEFNKLKRENYDIYRQLKNYRDSKDLENNVEFIKEKRKLLIARIVTIVLSLLVMIPAFIFLFNINNFDPNSNLLPQAISLASHTLPFLLLVYIIVSIFLFYKDHILLELINIIKGQPINKQIKKDNEILRNTLRVIILLTAITFIIIGIAHDEVSDVMYKAINICTECIGLG